MRLIKPYALKKNDAIGIFTPAWPGHTVLREKYEIGLNTLRKLGFEVKEGSLTAQNTHQGYRSGSPEERAREFMELIKDPQIKCIISVIGGLNSSSIIPYLNFDVIQENPKIICGYSDVNALQLAILKMTGVCCFYGPAVIPSFGEPGGGFKYTTDCFLRSISCTDKGSYTLQPPENWSNHFIDATQSGWKEVHRIYQPNTGWITHFSGIVEAPLLPVNLDTLLAIAGTKYFPDIENCILMIEEMHAPLDNFERNLSHLKLLGVFDKIRGLIISKTESIDKKGAGFSDTELLLEILGKNINYPVISNFDCGHTHPMITLQQMIPVLLNAQIGKKPIIEVLEPMVI